MRKIKILIILLLIVGCNKIEKIDTAEETQDTVEQQPLSEEEAWKLFDEFWVEFQRAVVEGDEEAIREMSEFEDENLCNNKNNYKLKTFVGCYIYHYFLTVPFNLINKNNNYTYLKIDTVSTAHLYDKQDYCCCKGDDNCLFNDTNMFILILIDSISTTYLNDKQNCCLNEKNMFRIDIVQIGIEIKPDTPLGSYREELYNVYFGLRNGKYKLFAITSKNNLKKF